MSMPMAKMTNVICQIFCRKKVSLHDKEMSKKSEMKNRKSITYYQPHSQFEKPSCAENLTFIIFHESAPFKLFENFYVHFTTAISQLEYLLICKYIRVHWIFEFKVERPKSTIVNSDFQWLPVLFYISFQNYSCLNSRPKTQSSMNSNVLCTYIRRKALKFRHVGTLSMLWTLTLSACTAKVRSRYVYWQLSSRVSKF